MSGHFNVSRGYNRNEQNNLSRTESHIGDNGSQQLAEVIEFANCFGLGST